MQKRLTFFIALVISFSSLAQVNLDSLWNVWNDNTQPDTNRLKAMNKIALDGYLFSQPDSAFYFAQLQYNFEAQPPHAQWQCHWDSQWGLPLPSWQLGSQWGLTVGAHSGGSHCQVGSGAHSGGSHCQRSGAYIVPSPF